MKFEIMFFLITISLLHADFSTDLLLLENTLHELSQSLLFRRLRERKECVLQGLKEVQDINEEIKASIKNLLQGKAVSELTQKIGKKLMRN